MFKRIAFIISILLLSFGTAQGQRLIDNQPYISARGGVMPPVGNNPFISYGHIDFGECTHYGRWYVGLSSGAANHSYKAVYSEDKVNEYEYVFSTCNVDVMAEGAYLLRIVSNRSRSVVFWGGIGMNAGARTYRLTDGPTPFSLPPVRFRFGFFPRLDLEVFVSKSLSLDVYAEPGFRISVGSRNDSWFKENSAFCPEMGIALTYYFFYD